MIALPALWFALLAVQDGDPPKKVGARPAAPDTREIRSRLVRRIAVDWDATPVVEAYAQVAAQLDLALVVAPALADRADEPVTLKLSRARGRDALRILADLLEVQYVVAGGLIMVTTPADAVRRTAVLQLHDARPALYRPPSFRPPREMGLRPGLREEMPPPEERAEGLAPEELVELIRRGTGVAHWEYDGVSLDCRGGRLVVRHTPSMQRRVARILQLLSAF